MLKIKGISILLVVIALLFGCSQSEVSVNEVNFNLLASEKTLPTNFDKIAFQRKQPPVYQYLVRKSIEQSEFEGNWNLYGYTQEIPDVDFNGNVVFFIGVRESGSCPDMIKSIQFNTESNSLIIPLTSPGGACTSDATPRSFAIQLEKELSEKINDLIIVKGNTETKIPIK